MNRQSAKIKHQWANKILLSFLWIIILAFAVYAQSSDCDTVHVNFVGDIETFETDPEQIIIRCDHEPFSLDAICVTILKSGFYRIYTGVIYSENQGNESFYLQFRRPDGTFVNQLEPNAGPYKVVPDTSFQPFQTTRDAGKFYFSPGSYTLQLDHYFLIQDEYPQFLNPPDIFMNGECPESVHFFNFQFEYLGDIVKTYDLAIQKSADRDTVYFGEGIEYQLQIENFGPATAYDFTLTDTLPDYIEIMEFSIPPDSISGNIFYWHFDSLRDGEMETIILTSRVDSLLPDKLIKITNAALVHAPEDTNQSNNYSSVSIYAERYEQPVFLKTDLAVTKTVNKDSILIGERLRYTLSLKNIGLSTAFQISLVDTLPECLTLLGMSPASDSIFDQVLIWKFDSLTVGGEVHIAINTVLNQNFPDSQIVITNSAFVQAEQDTNNQNNYDIAKTIGLKSKDNHDKGYDLEITKTASKDSVHIGEEFFYEIKIKNNGPDEAHYVTLVDSMPATVIPLDFQPAPDSLYENLYFWNFDVIYVGEEKLIIITAMLNPELADSSAPVINTVMVYTPEDSNIYGNWAKGRVIVIEEPEERHFYPRLKLTKQSTADTIRVGESFSYEIKIENIGKATAYEISLTDTLPWFVTVNNFNPTPNSTQGNIIFWNFDSLAVGQTIIVTYTATLDQLPPDSSFSLINVAAVTAPSDSNLVGEWAGSRVIIDDGRIPPNLVYNLGLSKQTDKDTVTTGESFVYILTITNYGPNTAYDITLTDTLPELIIASDFNPPPDSTYQNILYWFFDTLRVGEQISISFTATLQLSLPKTIMPIMNVAGIISPNDTNAVDNEDEAEVVGNRENEIIEDCNKSFYFDKNIFDPGTGSSLNIHFSIKKSQIIQLDLYDISGYHISTIIEDFFPGGINQYSWDGRLENNQLVGSGVYIITLRTQQMHCWKKVIIVR